MKEETLTMLRKYIRPALIYGTFIIVIYGVSIMWQSYLATRISEVPIGEENTQNDEDAFKREKREILERMASGQDDTLVSEKRTVLESISHSATTSDTGGVDKMRVLESLE